MVHKMKLQNNPFEMIKCGRKTIEMRLFDEKRSEIKIADVIEFTNIKSGEIIKAKVLDLHKFSTFEELYNKFDKTKLGYKQNDIASAEDMKQYYDVDKIKHYGVVGIEISLIKNHI